MNIAVQLFQIITLQRKTSDIDYNQSAAFFCFCAAIASGYFQIVAHKEFSDSPLTFVLAQALAQAGIIFLLLKLHKKANRFIQTATALFGIAAILQFLALVILQFPNLEAVGVIFTVWNFYLMILILKTSLECNLLQSILLTIGYHFVIGLILLGLFPELFAQMQASMQAAANAS